MNPVDLHLGPIQNPRMTKSTALPADLQQLLTVVGRRLEKGESVAAELSSVIAAISHLPAATISQSAFAIANTAKLYGWRKKPSWYRTLFQQHLTDEEQLLRLPDLRFLFLFHANGRLREASLQRITGGLSNPFLFAAVSIRLNDWAEPVRRAAFLCAKRCFPLTAPDVVADGATALAVRQDTWGRWGQEKEAVETALARPDVAEKIADIICGMQTGPASRIFRLVLRNNGIDAHLVHLAASARQPAVRAMAVQVIADNRASWAVGWDWKWLDKSMGERKRVRKFDFRDLQFQFDQTSVLKAAAADTSAIVRRAALTALICHRLGSAEAKELALQLEADANRSVRERAAFILSRVSEAAIRPEKT